MHVRTQTTAVKYNVNVFSIQIAITHILKSSTVLECNVIVIDFGVYLLVLSVCIGVRNYAVLKAGILSASCLSTH